MRRSVIRTVTTLILYVTAIIFTFNFGTADRTTDGSVGGYPGKMLFDDVSGEDHYNYCPSYIQTDSDTRYIFYCRNPRSGRIVDSIYWRKATRSGNTWIWGPQKEALAKGSGWESVHVCDPEVRKGEFKMNGHIYSWVMFYLGCDQLDNNHNQTGVAFADSIEGPWVKWQGNPLIEFSGTGYWGVGQPSATSVDGKGQLLLFYSKGDAVGTRTIRRHIDLSDMTSPDIGEEKTLFKDGLTGKDGSYAILHNAGFAYDGASDRFYLVRERHPFETLECNFISSELEVAYTSGPNVWNNKGVWIQDGLINPDNTGKYRNHNSGLLTDPYGNLSGGMDDYEIAFSVSDSGKDYLWTYRLYSIGKKHLGNIGKIDDRNAAVKYSGNWSQSESAGEQFYLQTSKWSSQTGAKASLSFRGGAVEIWGTKSSSHGKFRVVIDGTYTADVDTYSQTPTGTVLLYRAENLLTGFHGLSIEIAGNKHADSAGYKVDIDYFVVDVSERSYATPTIPALQSSSSSQGLSIVSEESQSISSEESQSISSGNVVNISSYDSKVISKESVSNLYGQISASDYDGYLESGWSDDDPEDHNSENVILIYVIGAVVVLTFVLVVVMVFVRKSRK